MARGAGVFEPPPLLFAPASRDGSGRGEGRGPWRPPRRSRPWIGGEPSPRSNGPRARQLGATLARAALIGIAAMLLLLGPLLSPAMAADLIHVGNAGAVAFSFVPAKTNDAIHDVEMSILPSKPDMSRLYTEAFLPQG
jgi:hypothetical protein